MKRSVFVARATKKPLQTGNLTCVIARGDLQHRPAPIVLWRHLANARIQLKAPIPAEKVDTREFEVTNKLPGLQIEQRASEGYRTWIWR